MFHYSKIHRHPVTTTVGNTANLPSAGPRQNGTTDNYHSPEDIWTSSTFIKRNLPETEKYAVPSQAGFTVLNAWRKKTHKTWKQLASGTRPQLETLAGSPRRIMSRRTMNCRSDRQRCEPLPGRLAAWDQRVPFNSGTRLLLPDYIYNTTPTCSPPSICNYSYHSWNDVHTSACVKKGVITSDKLTH